MSSESQVYQREILSAPKRSLTNLMFTSSGRIGRGRFWFGSAMIIALVLVMALLMAAMVKFGGGMDDDDGFSVSGLAALPFFAVVAAAVTLTVWSGICLGIKRYHDRGKSGAWILVQLIPAIGGLWYLIEAGCLRGTPGPNAYGPDPIGQAE